MCVCQLVHAHVHTCTVWRTALEDSQKKAATRHAEQVIFDELKTQHVRGEPDVAGQVGGQEASQETSPSQWNTGPGINDAWELGAKVEEDAWDGVAPVRGYHASSSLSAQRPRGRRDKGGGQR